MEIDAAGQKQVEAAAEVKDLIEVAAEVKDLIEAVAEMKELTDYACLPDFERRAAV